MGEGRPFIAIEFSKDCSNSAREWLHQLISKPKSEGGLQLEVNTINAEDAKEEVLIISCSGDHALMGAEIIGIRKQYKDGDMREFCFSDRKNFKNYEDDEFLSDSEKLQIIKAELDGLRATTEQHIPGHENAKLYAGKSIFRRMETNKLITNMFCLHDRGKLDRLRIDWYKNTNPTLDQPLDDVFHYFGGTISLYFAFLGFYTKMLIPLAALSLFYYTIGSQHAVMDYATFALFNILWSGIFLKLWERKSADHAYQWGTFGRMHWEDPRPGYRGPMGHNPITNREEPSYPSWKRKVIIVCGTGPVVALCVGFAAGLMFYYFSWEIYFNEIYKNDESIVAKLMINLPSIVYCCVILIANLGYRHLAEFLTDQENHRLQSSYINHLIAKIVLFDFVNNFLCLFYIAFIYNNMVMLRTTLRNVFLVQMIISQFLESVLPYLSYKSRSGKLSLKGADMSDEKTELSVKEQYDLEVKRDIYNGAFDDYLEMWLQFGYVVLFSCIFPAASIFALLNNVVELRSDAFKLCNVVRRPFADPSKNIGAWKIAFSMVAYIAVLSNCALIFQSPSFLKQFYAAFPTATSAEVVLSFILIEHFLLVTLYLVDVVISDTPGDINTAVKRVQYRSLQALKLQSKSNAIREFFKQKSIQAKKLESNHNH